MYVKGKFERKIFRSEATGFTVGTINIKESDIEDKDKIIFTGYFPEIIEGESYLMNGELTEHSKYGLQFSVTTYEKIKIETKEKLIDYLSSDLFPGIGKRIATKIVNKFELNTINTILEDKNNLASLNIPLKKINIIYENLIKYEESHNIIVYLSELGFTTKEALQIYTVYGKNTMLHLENNLYSLIDDIKDITFPKIDKLAEKFNVSKTASVRIEAGIIYSMKEYTFKTGDTYITIERLVNILNGILNTQIDDINSYLEELEQDSRIVIKDSKYYLIEHYQAEENIKEFITNLTKKKNYIYKNIDEDIENLEAKYNIKYNDMQKQAIKKAMKENITVITGGPGVGKTTIIQALVDLLSLYEDNTSLITLLAPTGRASKRLSEATKMQAMTIHRFLKWNKETDEFLMNESSKSDAKYVIVDEASMVDLLLFDSLLKALKSSIRLIIVGDYFQLPSVAPGQVLKDIIESDVIPVIHLNLLYRQNVDSFIPVLAEKIKTGDIESIFSEYDDYKFSEIYSQLINEEIKKTVENIIKEGKNYFDFQVMAPMYKGTNGIDNLNKMLQEICNPKTRQQELKVYDTIYRIKDKVIQLVNVPDENIFNGDIGVIEHIVHESISDSSKNEIYVNYDGNIVRYLPSDFNMIKHAYAISIHKSQGSEFDTVIIPLCPSFKRMLYRKLIYTGITRAKKKLFLIGEKDAFIYSIKNNNEEMRKSTLKEMLTQSFDN